MKNFVRSCLARQKKASESLKRFASFVASGKWKGSKKAIAIGLFALVVAIAIPLLIILSIIQTTQTSKPGSDTDTSEEQAGPRHPLTGEVIQDERTNLPGVFAVMVENAADAWPLSGIEDAFLVIEAPVEGNIPRFVAFYSEESESEKIGPVRSARPYYLDWTAWFNPLYAHVGGSPEGLQIVRERDVRDLDEFFQSEYFWRQTTGGRYAPHNTFTSTDLLKKALIEFPQEEVQYESWKYENGESKGAKSVSLDWSGGTTYDVKWEYNPETNRYTRWQGIREMIAEDGDNIFADSIVFVQMDMQTIDAVGRKNVETLGEGEAVFAQNGEVFFGTWRQSEFDQRMRFYTHAGQEVSLVAGVTWIEITDSVSKIEIKEPTVE